MTRLESENENTNPIIRFNMSAVVKIVLVVILVVALFATTSSQAAKGQGTANEDCKPYFSLPDLGEACDEQDQCSYPYECNRTTRLCSEQTFLLNQRCQTVSDCYTVPSSVVIASSPVVCAQNVCVLKRKRGESCQYQDQCPESFSCTQGKCVGKQLGEACTVDNDANKQGNCDVGLFCSKDTETCATRRSEGELCSGDYDCSSYYCSPEGKCAIYGMKAGDACHEARSYRGCSGSMFCNQDNKCQHPPGLGDKCDGEKVMCNLPFVCHGGVCVESFETRNRTECESNYGAHYMCEQEKCVGYYSKYLCGTQSFDAIVCAFDKCNSDVPAYPTLDKGSCVYKNCAQELETLHECKRTKAANV